ncbi:MAG: hypothetical protein ACI4FZ_07565 [Lachnospiraceae bacterium]
MKNLIFALFVLAYVLAFFAFSYVLTHYGSNFIPRIPFYLICTVCGFAFGFTIYDVMLFLYKKAESIAVAL